MSNHELAPDSTRAALRLGAWFVAYFVAHLFWSSASDVPSANEFASVDARGRATLHEELNPDWYLTPVQLESLAPASVEKRNREIEQLELSAQERIASYRTTTKGSNRASVLLLSKDLEAGNFTDAVARWQGIRESTSPRTLARFGRDNADGLATDLVRLEDLELAQRASLLELEPEGEAGFLWTSPTGAPLEVLAIAGLGALCALFLRRRSLRKQGYPAGPMPLRHVLGYAAGPTFGLLAWFLIRPELAFSQYAPTLLLLGAGFGFGFPFLAHGLARLLGRDWNSEQRHARSSTRKARIASAMMDLRPGSFAELKRSASQFAAELVATEVEQRPQP